MNEFLEVVIALKYHIGAAFIGLPVIGSLATAAAKHDTATRQHTPSGATFGPWADHARTCRCNICR